MPKYLLEDMVRDKRERQGIKTIKKIDKKEQPPKIEPKTHHSEGRSRFMLWFVAVVSIGFCFFALSVFFGRAQILVNPKIKDVVLNENLSAIKDSNDSLSFNLIVINDAEDKIIQATGQKDVAEKATGSILIFNAFSSSSQALNMDTRLEGSNGKIYKTAAKTIVPGLKKDGTPGSAEVGIYAAEAGAEYNSAPIDFKIFGFKGTPKYAKFYGRSKTGTEITGGFIGKAPAVSDADKATVESNLKTNLQAKLLKKATDQVPIGFVLFKNAIFLSTDDLNITSTYNKDNSMTLTEKGILYGILFNEQKLAKKIATDTVDQYDGSDVYISNIKDLSFSLAKQDNVSFADIKSINFNLSGSAKVVSRLDESKFINNLLGKSKKDFNGILAQYPNIDSANLTLTPMWKMSIPDQAKNVKIIVNYPK